MMNFLEIKNLLETNSSGLVFTLNNTYDNSGGVIYITKESSKNKLELTLTNKQDAPIAFKAGDLVSDKEITPDSPSSLFLYFNSILSNDEIKPMTVETPDWQFKIFTSKRGKAYLAIAPKKNITLKNGESITFKLNNIQVNVEDSKSGYHLSIDCYNIKGIENYNAQVGLSLLHLPTLNNSLRLKCDFMDRKNNYPYYSNYLPREIFISPSDDPFANYIRIALTNATETQINRLENAPSPEFYLIFTPGESKSLNPSAIGTLDEIASFSCSEYQVDEDLWEINKQDSEITIWGEGKTVTIWKLTPKVSTSSQILGIGKSIYFEFRNIITYCKQGITLLYIQYRHIPKYDDGYYVLAIEKIIPSPTIISYTCDKIPVDNKITVDYKEPIKLSWRAIYGDKCFFSEEGPKGDFKLTDSTEVLPTKNPSDYVLICSKNTTNQDSKDLKIWLNPPKINTFTCDLQKAKEANYLIGQDLSTTINWDTENGDCTLSDGNLTKSIANKGSEKVSVHNDITYTLTCQQQDTQGPPTQSISIKIMPVHLDSLEAYFCYFKTNSDNVKLYTPRIYLKCQYATKIDIEGALVDLGTNYFIPTFPAYDYSTPHDKIPNTYFLLAIKYHAALILYSKSEWKNRYAPALTAQITLTGKGGPIIKKIPNAKNWPFYDKDPHQ